MLVNPFGQLHWSEYEPDPGDDYVSTNLYRVDPRSGEDVRIARLTDIATTDYWDHLAYPGPNTWRLRVTVNRSGALIESDPVSASATIAFRGLWLHEIADPEEVVHLRATAVEVPRTQAQERRLAAGRRERTTFRGPLLEHALALQLIPEPLAEADMVEALDRMLDRQYTHDRVLCVRAGARAGARWFVVIDGGFREGWQGGLSRGSVQLVQESYEEAVA